MVFRITRKRTLATVAIVTGVFVAAAPVGAQGPRADSTELAVDAPHVAKQADRAVEGFGRLTAF